MFGMDERPLVFIFVFTYLHRRISFDGLQSQNIFKHILLKVDFFTPPPFSLCIIFIPLIFTCIKNNLLLFHVCYACVKEGLREDW